MKGAPAYFANLLGRSPKGVLPLRVPRQAAGAAPAESAPAGEWQETDAANAPHSSIVRRKVAPSNAAPSNAATPTAQHAPQGVSKPDTATRVLNTAPAAPPPDAPSQPQPLHTQRSDTTPAPAVHQPALSDSPARPPHENAQPLTSLLDRASGFWRPLDPSEGGEAPGSQPRRYNRFNAPPLVWQPTPAPAQPPQSAAAPTIEIGQIEVRIHPTPTPARPAPQPRAQRSGPLTRPRPIHGLRQS